MLCLGQLLKTICNLSKCVLCNHKLPQGDLRGRRTRSHPWVDWKQAEAATPPRHQVGWHWPPDFRPVTNFPLFFKGFRLEGNAMPCLWVSACHSKGKRRAAVLSRVSLFFSLELTFYLLQARKLLASCPIPFSLLQKAGKPSLVCLQENLMCQWKWGLGSSALHRVNLCRPRSSLAGGTALSSIFLCISRKLGVFVCLFFFLNLSTVTPPFFFVLIYF